MDTTGSVSRWWTSIPAGTRFILLVNVAVYVVGICTPRNWTISSNLAPQSYCMMPHVIWIDHRQCYRIVTSAFVHGGFLHLGFNMYNFVFAGGRLEQMMGTVRFVNLIVVWVLVLGILYFVIAFVGALFQYARFWNECAVGFSGVLFAILTVDSFAAPLGTQFSMFGWQIPARWYPWAMLIFTQVLMPNVSFIGHLVGILGAFVFSHGLLDCFMLPPFVVLFLEKRSCFRTLERWGWVRSPPLDSPRSSCFRCLGLIPCCGRVQRFFTRLCRSSDMEEDDLEAAEGYRMGSQPRFTGFGTWGSAPSSSQAVYVAVPVEAQQVQLPSRTGGMEEGGGKLDASNTAEDQVNARRKVAEAALNRWAVNPGISSRSADGSGRKEESKEETKSSSSSDRGDGGMRGANVREALSMSLSFGGGAPVHRLYGDASSSPNSDGSSGRELRERIDREALAGALEAVRRRTVAAEQQELLNSLVEMGFPREEAEKALEAEGDILSAVERLTKKS